MFGYAAFGEVAFGALPDISVRMRCIATLSVDFNFKIYAASAPFMTDGDDTPAQRPFEPTIDQPISFTRSILGGNLGIGQFTIGDGTLTLVNTDANYDNLIDRYAIDGRDVTIKIGRLSDALNGRYGANFFTIFKGTSPGWNVDEQFLTVTLRDYGYKLSLPLQANLYGGTGGADGGADLAGKRIPVGYGTALNISAPLVAPSLLLYQVNDGSVQDITAVYDRGASLTKGADYPSYALLAAGAVAGGTYATCLAGGYFRLGSSAAGTVTADIKGDNSGAGYVETTADIIRRIVGTRTVLNDPADIYGPAFDFVNAAQPAPVGYWSAPDDNSAAADVIARLMNGIGGWGGFRRNGKFEIGIFLAPSGPPTARYAREDIETLTREALPTGVNPPPWRFRVGYQRNYTVQTDIAGSVNADRIAFLAEQYRTGDASSAAVQSDHPFAQDPAVIEGYFANQADAAAEAARLLALYRKSAALFRILIDQRGFTTNLGETVSVTFPRWDLTLGRLMRIIQIAEDGQKNTVELVCFG